MNEVMMQCMTWVDYQRRVEQDGAMVFIPCGALEQHGPHLPLGVDALLATDIARLVAERCGGIVAAPLYYGYKSQARCGGGQCFPGTTSLDGDNLTQQLRSIIRELARHGVRHLVVVDGHYENQWFLTEAIELAVRDLGADPGLRILRTEYWEFCPQTVLDKVFENGFPGFALEHAALIETSMMLRLHPELVWIDRIPDHGPAEFPLYDLYPQNGKGVPHSGVLASAKGASADKGRMIVDAIVDGLTTAVTEAFA